MENTAYRAIAIVGAGAVLPDAPNVAAFWENVKNGRYSISDVTPDRWDPALYYDADPNAPDKTYSKIGGWVREYAWDPMKWRLPIPPRVADAMDECAKVGHRLHPRSAGRLRLSGAAAGSRSHGCDPRQCHGRRKALSHRRCACSFLNTRANWPEVASFAALPEPLRARHHPRIARSASTSILPEVTEDTMPGELANCIAGPHREHLQLPRSQLRMRRRLRIGHGGHQFGRSRDWSRTILTCRHRRHRPQHGRAHLRQVLQDRRALRHRHASLCGGSRRLRHGRRRRDLPAQASGRRRARRRQDLRRAARHRRYRATARERASRRPTRSGQKFAHRARLGERRLVARYRDTDRRPRHIHQRGRCGRSAKHG